MKVRNSITALWAMILVVFSVTGHSLMNTPSAHQQDNSNKPKDVEPAPTPAGTPNAPEPVQQNIPVDEQASEENGITVGKPKQFDERTLTLMLQSLEDKLARTQFPDPTGLYGSVGRFAGATASTTSMALSVRGPASPSITTTVGGTTKDVATGSVTEGGNQTTTVAPTGTTSVTGNTITNTTGTTGEETSSNQRQITQPGLAPPSATLPSQTSNFSYQPSFGISSQDLLAEQTSLFYQIVNLRLLLDRSLTDRLDIIHHPDKTTLKNRQQIVVGFQISIDAAHKDAVAEAEVTVEGNRVSLVSLLPGEKTYNVASVTKDSKAIDMGAVVQFVGVGASVGKTQESLYLVKDTDTVALERVSQKKDTLKFAWQFRPVLGKRTVEPGLRQVYALVSVPEESIKNLKITAITRWRRYDRKAKAVGDYVKNTSDTKQYENFPLPLGDQYYTEFSLKPHINRLVWSDTGNGQVLAVVEGEGFTPDTTIVLGNTVLSRPEHGLTIANERRLFLVAPGHLLERSLPWVVGRYGTTEFRRQLTVGSVPVQWPYASIELLAPVIKARDPQTSDVTVSVRSTGQYPLDIRRLLHDHKPIVVIGEKVFGLSDAPFVSRLYSVDNREAKLTFVAPTQLLANARSLIFKEFLWNEGALTIDLILRDSFMVTSLTTLGSNGDHVQLAISGGGFTKQAQVIVGDVTFAVACPAARPDCVAGLKLNATDGTATLITLSPTKGQMKDIKQLLVLQGLAQPQSLAVTTPAPPVPPAKIITPAEPLTIGKGDSVAVKFAGANFESIKKIMFEGTEIKATPDEKDKTVLWIRFETFLTGEAGTKQIIFLMKDDKEVPFTVVVR